MWSGHGEHIIYCMMMELWQQEPHMHDHTHTHMHPSKPHNCLHFISIRHRVVLCAWWDMIYSYWLLFMDSSRNAFVRRWTMQNNANKIHERGMMYGYKSRNEWSHRLKVTWKMPLLRSHNHWCGHEVRLLVSLSVSIFFFPADGLFLFPSHQQWAGYGRRAHILRAVNGPPAPILHLCGWVCVASISSD